jgi:chromosome segregation ATPase
LRGSRRRREERKTDQIRAAVAEAMAAYQATVQPQTSIDMTGVNSVLQELRQLAQHAGSRDTQSELKTIMEDVISHHPRLRGSRVREDHETAEMKLRPQIDGLETMLKISQEHAAEEARLRRKAEEEINELKLRLRIAEEEAAQYRESSEEAQNTLAAFVEEKESYRNLEHELEDLTLKNTALEKTLKEYRVSSDQWREDVRDERASNKDLKRTLKEVHQQLEEQTHSRQGLRAKIERLHSQMAQAIQDIHAEQEDWRNKEHSLQSKLALTQDSLEHEKRHREKAELELDALDKEHKTNLHLKTILEQAQLDVSRLNELISSLREENRALDTKVFTLDRELEHTKNSKDAELATSTFRLQVELESALGQLDDVRKDSDAQILRLQGRLDQAELDLQEQKSKHDALFTETVEAHQQALREANEKKETALEDFHQIHEKKLNELRDRHTRELHNSFDNRSRLEHQFNERLSLSDDKIKHLESKVVDLENTLAITKSAARAAVEAATAKGVNLPTPANSVVASPPQRAASASMSFAKGSEVPEKISPQALRESIMVLQDQLQNREQRIEQLEAELTAVDKDAPAKVKERDTEIGWLRELLGVRVDDLEDLTNALSKPDFDRDTVRDAAIRLRANLQMERQLRDRAAAGSSNSFPSISSLSSYAQSPRAIPMAAAAAWGNWRKARDTSFGALSELATNLSSQTPSKSTMGSPASFLSGMITPPATNQKAPTPNDTPFQAPPSMRPLAAAAQIRKSSGPEARPLRAYSSQPRALSSRQADKRPASSQSASSSLPSQLNIEPPRTPTQAKHQPSLDLTEDVDDDASPLDGKEAGHFDNEEESLVPAE